MERDDPAVEIVITPEGRHRRTVRLPLRTARAIAIGAMALVLLAGGALTIWPVLAARAWQAGALEREVASLLTERDQVEELVSALAEVEAAYERIRTLYAPDVVPNAGAAWLPPAGGRPIPSGSDADRLPSAWPLTERGFISQVPIPGPGPDHEGIDVAVPSGSYIRAAGDAQVIETGEDPVYGLYLVLDHGEGYRSLYAHASLLLAREGDRVRRGEVVGLTGSTGRSTAPHLHFEISLDGEAIDPLTLVQQP